MRLEWDEQKRAENLKKHGLDFADALKVLTADYRMDMSVIRNGEQRTVSFACVADELTVWCLVHTHRLDAYRIVSFRKAHEKERSLYHEWKNQIQNF